MYNDHISIEVNGFNTYSDFGFTEATYDDTFDSLFGNDPALITPDLAGVCDEGDLRGKCSINLD